MSGGWQPLCAEDPVPGDPDAVREAAGAAGAAAELLLRQAEDLEALAAMPQGESDAVDALRSDAGELSRGLRHAEQRYRAVGEALRTWAPILEDCQRRALAALRDAREADGRLATLTGPVPGPNPGSPEDVEAEGARQARREAAMNDIDSARARLADVVQDRELAGRRAAAVVRAASGDERAHSGWWNYVRGGVAGAVLGVGAFIRRHAAGLQQTSSVLGYLATGAGVLALALAILATLPVSAALAGFAAGAAVWLGVAATFCAWTGTALDTGLASSGAGSWTDVGVDLIGIALGNAGGRALRAAGKQLGGVADEVAGKPAERLVRQRSRRQVRRARRALKRGTPTDRAAARRRLDAMNKRARLARKTANERALARQPGLRGRRHQLILDSQGAEISWQAAALRARHGADPHVAQAVRRARRVVAGVAAARVAGYGLDADQKAGYPVHLPRRRHRPARGRGPGRQRRTGSRQ